MKLRVTIQAEAELGLERALEKYGTTDPYAIAQKMQQAFHEEAAENDDLTQGGLRVLGCTVLPVHG